MTPSTFKSIRERAGLFPIEESAFAVRFWAKVEKCGADECWNWKGRKWKGGTKSDVYGSILVHGKWRRAHRASLSLYMGRQIGDGMQVLHSCDNTLCVNPAHLREGTAKENRADAIERNRLDDRSGIRNPNTRLSDEQVAAIRECGLSRNMIARLVGISPQAVRAILSGKTWK